MTESQEAALWGAAYHHRLVYLCGNYVHNAGDEHAHADARRYADAVVAAARQHAPRTGQGPGGGEPCHRSDTTSPRGE